MAENDSLKYENKHAWQDKEDIMAFSEGYKDFMKHSKTERHAISNIKKILEDNGFKRFDEVREAREGDRIYKMIKDKTIFAFVVGKEKDNLQIVGSHVDSPRLDLKPIPLYEESSLSLLKTHYYGGIKKYHWVNLPLELKGVIFTKDGRKVDVNEGNFIIPDLLAHLARKQMEKTPKEMIQGEELNILIGNIPVEDEEEKEKLKRAMLNHLKEKYNILEEDFAFAELELVPAQDPMDIGFDKSMVGAYGQDDKVCAYTSLKALIELEVPGRTALGFFVDKEEIGSVGDTGAASLILQNFAHDYRRLMKLDKGVDQILSASRCVSADVTAGLNPNYKDAHDPQNASKLGHGISVEKYGGSGGKYSTHDAHAEYMQYLRSILDKEGIEWQTGELGKIDLGGGGTIGMFMSRYGMDCVDAGPCVLGMHSPCEVVSKADIYSAYRFYRAFFVE
ncbi:MAG: aminopeptidase [Nanobdellota archaeon]